MNVADLGEMEGGLFGETGLALSSPVVVAFDEHRHSTGDVDDFDSAPDRTLGFSRGLAMLT